MKLLVVKTSSLGDVVHTLPALTEAVAARPDLVVDWAVEPAFADVVRLHPQVRRIWPTPIRRWRRAPLHPGTWREVLALRRGLRAERYDLVLDAQGLFKSALVAQLAGRPVAGLDRVSSRGGIAAVLYGQRHAIAWDRHALDRARLLFGAALGYRPDEGAAPELPAAGTPAGATRRALLLHGTTWPAKRWPLSHWVGLAEGLAARGFRPAVVSDGGTEDAFVRDLVRAAPSLEVLGRRPLAEVARLVADSALVIGVDTGLTHLAAALGRPTVALFGPTAPDRTGPRGSRVVVLGATTPCAPCLRRVCPLVPAGVDPPCHGSVDVPRSLAAADALLGVPSSRQ